MVYLTIFTGIKGLSYNTGFSSEKKKLVSPQSLKGYTKSNNIWKWGHEKY